MKTPAVVPVDFGSQPSVPGALSSSPLHPGNSGNAKVVYYPLPDNGLGCRFTCKDAIYLGVIAVFVLTVVILSLVYCAEVHGKDQLFLSISNIVNSEHVDHEHDHYKHHDDHDKDDYHRSMNDVMVYFGSDLFIMSGTETTLEKAKGECKKKNMRLYEPRNRDVHDRLASRAGVMEPELDEGFWIGVSFDFNSQKSVDTLIF